MAFFFSRTRSRPPLEIVKSAKDSLSRLWDGPVAAQRVGEELAKQLNQMKFIVQGTQETDSSPEQVDQLIHAMIQEDLFYLLARSIHLLPFEARKDAQTIFSHALRFNKSNDPEHPDLPALVHATESRPEVVVELCRGYRHSQSALPCGSILREALKHKFVAGVILYDQSKDGQRAIRLGDVDVDEKQRGDGVIWEFFGWINQSAFEVSADAFTTFRVWHDLIAGLCFVPHAHDSSQEILTKHKNLVAHYLTTNFDLFFSRYNTVLMQSESYVTKRQSIKLLGEILLDRANYNVMTAYVDRGEHLKLCMNLLKDDRKMVQYEGFHVFKVFVANPNKSVAVQRILINNRDRLLKFLPRFLEDRTEDDQFTDEKSFLVRQIELLPPEPVEPTKQGAVHGNGVGVAATS